MGSNYESRSNFFAPDFAYTGGLDGTIHAAYAAMDAQKLVSPDGSASRSMLTPTRVGDVGLSRDLRCRLLRTPLTQRIPLCSDLTTLPGPVTVTARSALAFSNRLLDHHARQLSRLQTSKTTLEAIPSRLD